MKGYKFSWMGLAGLVLLSGCSGFWDKSTSGGGTGNGTASGVFYVANQKTSTVAGLYFAKGVTTTTAVTNSPYSPGTAPIAMAISPNGSFLYVSTAVGIYLYTVGSGGELTIANNSQVISSDPANAMAIDPTGAWLIEASSGLGTVNAIPLSATTGGFDSTIGVKSVNLPSTTVAQLAVTAANAANPYVFVAMGSGGTAIVPFTAGNTTSNPFGTVATVKLLKAAGADNAIAVDPSNRLLYVGETVALSGTQTGGLRVFSIGAGANVTELTGSPYATGGTGPSAILATTNFVYVANRAVSGSNNGNVSGYSIAASGGTSYTLTLVNTIAAGISTVGLVEDNTSTYILAVNTGGSSDLNAYTFDTTGKLTSYASTSTGTDPVQAVAIVAHP